MITISECYLTLGEYFLETDMFKAFGYFEEAARNGSGKAAMKVAEYYEKLGKYDKAYEMLVLAAETNDEKYGEAAYKLGTYHEYGYAGLMKDCDRAYEYYSGSAERGYKLAKGKMSYEKIKKFINALKMMVIG